MALRDAIIATYMTIHMAPSPGSTTHDHARRGWFPRVKELRLSPSRGMEILGVWPSGNKGGCPRNQSRGQAMILWRSPKAPTAHLSRRER
jgi:hypothetical protein